MKLEDRFRVDVARDQAWAILLDVERIAPCLPGAQLQEVEGDQYRGIVKIKVGPITAEYRGVARITEADESTGRIAISAEGRDTRGQGNASATVVAVLTADGAGTDVAIETDLTVTGKVAQFGRGVMADVSKKLLAQFVANLERDVLAGPATVSGSGPEPGPVSGGAGAATELAVAASGGSVAESSAPPEVRWKPPEATPGNGHGVRRIDAPEPEAVDLMDVAGGAVAKRLLPLLAVAAVVGVLLARRRRR